jgi:hypothetical protein
MFSARFQHAPWCRLCICFIDAATMVGTIESDLSPSVHMTAWRQPQVSNSTSRKHMFSARFQHAPWCSLCRCFIDTASHRRSQPQPATATASHNHSQPQPQPATATASHSQPQPQPATASHSHSQPQPQPATASHTQPQPATESHGRSDSAEATRPKRFGRSNSAEETSAEATVGRRDFG